MLLANLVDGEARDHDHDFRVVTFDHRLTAKARGWGKSGRLVQKIVLGFFGLRELVRAGFDHYVAGRAGAIAAARVLEMDVMAKHDVENRARLAVVGKGSFGRIEFDHALRLTALEDDAKSSH